MTALQFGAGLELLPRKASRMSPLARACAGVLAIALVLLVHSAAAGDVDLERRIHSPALGHDLDYGLYLPSVGAAPYPVVYLLHGYGATHREWIELGRVDALFDRLMADGAVRPFVAVMPAGAKSWYVDSAARGGPGDFATAIARDLVAHIDATVPTRAAAEGRAVMGLSMGGFGALHLAFAQPERFGQAIALSPAVFRPGGLSWERWSLGSTPDELAFWFQGAFGRPFDVATYLAEQPFAQIDALAGLDRPPRILLATGEDDAFGFELGTVELFLALRAAEVPADLRVAAGGHDWAYWRQATAAALRWLDAGWAEAEGD